MRIQFLKWTQTDVKICYFFQNKMCFYENLCEMVRANCKKTLGLTFAKGYATYAEKIMAIRPLFVSQFSILL